MSQLDRPTATIHYEVWGEAGNWVTLVNGHTRPLNDFRMLGRHLAGQGYQVLALDNRGAGRTETAGPFTLADMADDVLALWDTLGVTQSHLLGVSMGGFIALSLALAHSTRVRRLVLVSTAMSQELIYRDDSRWEADPARVEAKLAPYFTEDFRRRNSVLVKSMVKQIAKAVAEGGFAERSEQQRRAIAGFDVASQLGGLQVPTLVIHGVDDRIIPVAAARALEAAIPDARLALLPGAGHLLLAERPKELYALVGDWLQG